jgi:hypothetical protein
MAAEDAIERKRSPAGERGSSTGARWPVLIHRGSLIVCIASFALALVVAIRDQGALAASEGSLQGAFVLLLVAVLVGVLALAVALFRPERGQLRGLIITTAAWSAVLVVALAVVWVQIAQGVRDVRREASEVRPLLDQADVDAFLAPYSGALDAVAAPPYRIPTGVLLESLEFLTANNVQVSGYVWQKWPADVPAAIKRGFELPDALDTADPGDPIYTATEVDGTILIGWRVQTTLRESFFYHHYPFDRHDVWLRLWPRDFGGRVVLVPDFASYPNLDPAALPGLDTQFVNGGWIPEHSHFAYGAPRYDASLGFPASQEEASYPELYFKVGLERDFLEPFLDYVIFALAVALLLFGVLVLTTKDQATSKRFGLSTFGVLGSAGTLLFAVILKETQLRNAIDPDQLVYLEVLPFLLIVAILLIVLNAIVIAAPLNRRLPFLEYRNNLLPTLLYWPAMLGALLAVTLITFFR